MNHATRFMNFVSVNRGGAGVEAEKIAAQSTKDVFDPVTERVWHNSQVILARFIDASYVLGILNVPSTMLYVFEDFDTLTNTNLPDYVPDEHMLDVLTLLARENQQLLDNGGD